MRVGFGYDVHPLVRGRRLVLGGMEIPHDKGLDGYSDADVLIHAIIDALLGAAALGDIGTHFPSSEPKYKDVSSVALLRQTGDLLLAQGWKIGNIDATIVAEYPPLSPLIPRMRQVIAETLGIGVDRVGVKSTTSKGLGFLGQGEGIAAHVVALVEKGKALRDQGVMK